MFKLPITYEYFLLDIQNLDFHLLHWQLIFRSGKCMNKAHFWRVSP